MLKNFSIEIEQKLYDKQTPFGNLAVYQSQPFGMLLTLNHHVVLSQHDSFFYHEMLTHPALFSHPEPQSVLIIGNCFGVLQEILKHPTVKNVVCLLENEHLDEAVSTYFSDLYSIKNDPRVQYHCVNPITWLNTSTQQFDIIIQSQYSDNFLQEHYHHYQRALCEEGILVQPCQTSLLQLTSLKPIYQHVKQAGFNDWQILNFPQPSHTSGWRTVMMATKRAIFKHVREKDVFNRPFETRYYNYDIHKAALVLPEFMREKEAS